MMVGLIELTGGYGLLRVVIPLFPGPAASLWWVLAAVGGMTVLYCASNAIGQDDLHLASVQAAIAMIGFVCIGIAVLTPAGVNGASIILLSQGLIAPFMIAIAAVAARALQRGELLPRAVVVCLTIGWLAELVMPGLFGQFMVLLGAFQAHQSGSVLSDQAASLGAIDALIAATVAGIVLIGIAGARIVRRIS
jgi:NADH-quinone oxidoreductase subunit M